MQMEQRSKRCRDLSRREKQDDTNFITSGRRRLAMDSNRRRGQDEQRCQDPCQFCTRRADDRHGTLGFLQGLAGERHPYVPQSNLVHLYGRGNQLRFSSIFSDLSSIGAV